MTRVVLAFPGQGAQRAHMAVALYRHHEHFAALVEETLAHWGPEVRADWLAGRPVDHVTRSTPLLYAIDLALGRLVLAAGVRPAGLLGHSVGEWAALTLAGVLDPATAAGVLRERVARMAASPPGGMLAVAGTEAEVREVLAGARLAGHVSVAVVNAPRQIVLSGLALPLRQAEKLLRTSGFTVLRVPATTAFHSPVLAGDPGGLAGLRPMRIPLYSSAAGGPLSPAQARDPGFWASRPAAPVRFWDALCAVFEVDTLLLECGPGRTLSTVARQHRAVLGGRCRVLPLLPQPVASRILGRSEARPSSSA